MLGFILRSVRGNLFKGFSIFVLALGFGGGGYSIAAGDTGLPMLSLDECIRLAVEGSPNLKITGERQNIASHGVRGAYGNFLPSLGVSRSWTSYERTDYDVLFNTGKVDSSEIYMSWDEAGDMTRWYSSEQAIRPEYIRPRATSKGWNGRAELDVFSGFSKFTRLKSAKNELYAAKATHDYTRELVVEEVITAYFNLLRYKELLQVAIDTRDQAAKELERTETYFRLGSAAKSDVLQQSVRLENTKLDHVIADNNVNKAFADLAFAMNQPLAETFSVDKSELITEYEMEGLDALYQAALSNRLDLRSREFGAEARRKDVGTAKSSLYPSLSFSAAYNRSDSESDEKFSPSQSSSSNSFGYAVSWNVFDRLQTWTGISRAKANARIAEYELEQARLNVQLEIRQLHNSQVEARERANVSHETIQQSAEELRLARERFRVGAGTTLDVIVAQVNSASARAQEVQAKCDFLIAKAKMDRAVGRLHIRGGGH